MSVFGRRNGSAEGNCMNAGSVLHREFREAEPPASRSLANLEILPRNRDGIHKALRSMELYAFRRAAATEKISSNAAFEASNATFEA